MEKLGEMDASVKERHECIFSIDHNFDDIGQNTAATLEG